jgi:hypothetical protein
MKPQELVNLKQRIIKSTNCGKKNGNWLCPVCGITLPLYYVGGHDCIKFFILLDFFGGIHPTVQLP